MLIKFKVENFKSFKEETVLDMTKTNYKEHGNSTINIGGDELLSIAAIYGANASGKSNLIDALKYMILKSYYIENTDSIKDILDKDNNGIAFFANKDKPTKFEIDFINIREYRYGFSIKNDKIVEEYLYVVKGEEYLTVFERKVESNKLNLNEELIDLKDVLTKINPKRTMVNFIFESFELESMNLFNGWITKVAILLKLHKLEEKLFSSNTYTNTIVDNGKFKNFIQTFDNTVKEIELEEVENEKGTKIYFIREIDGKIFRNNLFNESKGTIKMVNLYSSIYHSLRIGLPLIIDELDISLHPLLLRLIIQMFHDSNTNGQLIMTLHDISVLNKDLLRRDEIWFIEKNDNLESELYSLVELRNSKGDKIRNDATYYKDYLNGYYGAIPSLERFDIDGK